MRTNWNDHAPSMRLAVRVIAVAAALLPGFPPASGWAQDPAAVRLNGERRSAIVAELNAILRANYVFPNVADEVASALTERVRRGEYDAIVDPQVFSDSLTSHLYDVAADRHLWVSFSPNQPDASTDSQAPTRELTNFGFRRVEVLAGNVGYIEINRFADPAGAGATAVAAMQFLAPVDAVIIDVRSGPGGYPAMVALLLSYFVEPTPVHLWDVYRRIPDRTDQGWTSRYVPGERLLAQPVFVLTSGRTFSASEALAYTLKHLGRATIVGERTGGGANPGRQHRIDDAFTAFVPNARLINPITGSSWQGTGVAPDVTVSSELALDMAYVLALDALLQREQDPDHVAALTEIRTDVSDRLEKARAGHENFLATCPSIELSVVVDMPSDSARSVALSDGTRVLLTEAPLLTSIDVVGASASLTEGQYVLNIDVTAEAAIRVQVFSEQNVGQRMAFLVDGRIIQTPTIQDPITGNGFFIGAFERAEAERLADALNSGCRP